MKKYYVTANTAEGLINHVSSNLQNIKQIIILKHPSNSLKTGLIQQVIDSFQPNYEIEVLLSSLSSKYLDGIIIRDKSLAVICDQVATTDIKTFNAIEIDCSLFIKDKPVLNKELEKKITYFTEKAYEKFKTGLTVHDDLETIFINEMDFNRANELAKELIQRIMENQSERNRVSTTYHRLFGTNTADGVVNEVPHIIEQMKKVFYIKGRAGTGKSTFMRKIVEACEDYGFDLELYHCSFDPGSLDMVLVPELEFCMFDSTDPHEFFPTREGEEIIDLYEEAVKPGTDEKYEEQISKVNNHYKSFMKQGVKELKKAGEYREKYEKQFSFTEEEKNAIFEFINKQVIQ
ncbi:hypothetical protein [Oceanobacillus sp. Castelsardo]|uniref:hypothetical protein n=1 Tax=Oceanobacillus sp. Castelsardo TaxID=1851204 RepID=UPI0008384F88|nr:hypothetical protein [Oceanobacillus sp. Castelsardo]